MTSFVEGNCIRLLENGGAYFPALIDAFEQAQREVFVESYIFAADETGWLIAGALCDAARRGVRVNVLVDGFGSRAFINRLQPALESAGVRVLVYRRELRLLSLRRHRLRRLHRKVVMVDDRIAFVGGINIVDDFEPAGPPHPRYDYAVQIEGPVLASISRDVRRLWWLVAWASLRRRKTAVRLSTPPPVIPGNVRLAFVVRDTFRHRHDIEQAYLSAIAAAREEVLIANAYFFPGRHFRQALVDARARGVRVTLLLQGLSDHPLLAHASRALYPYFLAAGVRLFEYEQSYLHAKVAVIDRHWATVGSSNIDPFSLLLAREANVLVDDAQFADQLHASLCRAMQSGARELHLEELRRSSWWRRAGRWLAYQVVRIAIGVAGFRGQH